MKDKIKLNDKTLNQYKVSDSKLKEMPIVPCDENCKLGEASHFHLAENPKETECIDCKLGATKHEDWHEVKEISEKERKELLNKLGYKDPFTKCFVENCQAGCLPTKELEKETRLFRDIYGTVQIVEIMGLSEVQEPDFLSNKECKECPKDWHESWNKSIKEPCTPKHSDSLTGTCEICNPEPESEKDSTENPLFCKCCKKDNGDVYEDGMCYLCFSQKSELRSDILDQIEAGINEKIDTIEKDRKLKPNKNDAHLQHDYDMRIIQLNDVNDWLSALKKENTS